MLLITVSVYLTGCSNEQVENNESTNRIEISSGWPKVISTRYGDVTINKPPKRIVSTSVTLTGTLIAIDAPVIASGGTYANSIVADDIGYFRQWAEIAKQKKVTSLYQGEANAESVAKQKPDLIIISATGGDSALKLHEQFSSIAPTLVINYDDKSWQALAVLLGEIVDREFEAKSIIKQFDEKLKQTREVISLPPQPVTAMAYYGDNRGGNIWTADSAQGNLLMSLGFSLSAIPEHLKDNHIMGVRKDIVPVNGENFADAITGQSLLLFPANEKVVDRVYNNKFLALLPAVKNEQTYAMGNDTFRLDYYSSMNLLDTVESLFRTTSTQ